jgi:uncharacterized membrane protein
MKMYRVEVLGKHAVVQHFIYSSFLPSTVAVIPAPAIDVPLVRTYYHMQIIILLFQCLIVIVIVVVVVVWLDGRFRVRSRVSRRRRQRARQTRHAQCGFVCCADSFIGHQRSLTLFFIVSHTRSGRIQRDAVLLGVDSTAECGGVERFVEGVTISVIPSVCGGFLFSIQTT